ncbi:MAG: PEP-CTERM sorting domain-containing protein [Akkermansiaceae bacterium]
MKTIPLLLGALTFSGAASLTHATVLSSGLVGYYTFDSDTAADTSSAAGGSASNNAGTWTGAASYKAGAFGRAAEVGDGAGSNFITLTGSDYNFGSTGSFTVIYWINLADAVTSDPVVVAGGGKDWSLTGSSQGWVSALGAGDDVKANIGDGTNRGDTALVDLDHDAYWVGQGQPGEHWNFVALTLDRNSQTLTNYVADDWVTVTDTTWSLGVLGQDFGPDGSAPVSDLDVSDVGDITNGNLDITVGQDGDFAGYSLPLSGIDDLSVWNRALTQQELWEIYANGRNGNALSVVLVPEPSSIALLGLGAFAFILRRKK